MDEQELGSSSVNTSADLSAAVESISTEAPKLSGLDKLKAQRDHVEKTGELPKSGTDRGADGKFQPKVPTKPAPGAAQVPVTPAAQTPANVDPNAPVEAYKPDFKYKAQGKEFEVPEKFKALITDKESEEEVKKILGQAASYEDEKTTNTTLKTKLNEVGGAHNKMMGGVNQLRQMVGKGDFDSFFKGMNIPEEKIYQWVLDKVQYNQLPPEQKAQIDQQRNLQKQAETAQQQVGQASHREMELATRIKTMELEQTFGKTDVKSMSDAFDQRVGKPGAFKEAIIAHGQSVWALSNGKLDLTPEQAVADFVQKYGNPSAFANANPAAGAATQVQNAPSNAPSANATPPVKVIPNVAGRSASPVKQKPKNLEDLKRLRDAAIKEDNASRSPSQGYLAG
jgi:hypothetical protein